MPCALCRVHAAGSSQDNLIIYGNATATETMCISLKTKRKCDSANHGSRGKCVCERERERDVFSSGYEGCFPDQSALTAPQTTGALHEAEGPRSSMD